MHGSYLNALIPIAMSFGAEGSIFSMIGALEEGNCGPLSAWVCEKLAELFVGAKIEKSIFIE
jgi:hypothetical protein